MPAALRFAQPLPLCVAATHGFAFLRGGSAPVGDGSLAPASFISPVHCEAGSPFNEWRQTTIEISQNDVARPNGSKGEQKVNEQIY